MINQDVEKVLSNRFGREKLVIFAEMVSVMFDILHKGVIKRDIDDACDYDYEAMWWAKRFVELKNEGNGD